MSTCLRLSLRPQKCIISQRCVDVDKVVPQHMGISKAILENVIFVHQEEANWPLRESKVLVRTTQNNSAAGQLNAVCGCTETEVRRHFRSDALQQGLGSY